jgi:hypothetical protein
MTMPVYCQRPGCNGRMFADLDGDSSCIRCGWVAYRTEPLPLLTWYGKADGRRREPWRIPREGARREE